MRTMNKLRDRRARLLLQVLPDRHSGGRALFARGRLALETAEGGGKCGFRPRERIDEGQGLVETQASSSFPSCGNRIATGKKRTD